MASGGGQFVWSSHVIERHCFYSEGAEKSVEGAEQRPDSWQMVLIAVGADNCSGNREVNQRATAETKEMGNDGLDQSGSVSEVRF